MPSNYSYINHETKHNRPDWLLSFGYNGLRSTKLCIMFMYSNLICASAVWSQYANMPPIGIGRVENIQIKFA